MKPKPRPSKKANEVHALAPHRQAACTRCSQVQLLHPDNVVMFVDKLKCKYTIVMCLTLYTNVCKSGNVLSLSAFAQCNATEKDAFIGHVRQC